MSDLLLGFPKYHVCTCVCIVCRRGGRYINLILIEKAYFKNSYSAHVKHTTFKKNSEPITLTMRIKMKEPRMPTL